MHTRQLTIAIWFALCSLFLLQSPALSKSQKQENKSIIFPEKISLGNFYYLKNTDIRSSVIQTGNTKVRMQAQGVVTVPKEGFSYLSAGYVLGESLQPLAKLKADDLQILKLNKLAFPDSELKYLSGLTGLIRLELDSTDVTDDGVKALAKLQNLAYLSLARTLITGKTLGELAPLKKLKDLQLGHNQICDGNLDGAKAIPNLLALRIQACQLNDKDLIAVGQMKSLTSLTLHENSKLTDKGIQHLAKLPKLRYIDIGQTKVTVPGMNVLKACPLETIRVDIAQFNANQLSQLRAAFPKASVNEEKNGGHMDPELFAPLH